MTINRIQNPECLCRHIFSVENIFVMSNMVFKKQHHPDEIPAFSNQDIYEYIYGKKPPGYISKLWIKAKRKLGRNEIWTDSSLWNFVGGLSLFLTVIPFLLIWESAQTFRQAIFPLQLGACLLYTSPSPRDRG